MELLNQNTMIDYVKIDNIWHQFEGNIFACYDVPEHFTITPLNIFIKEPLPSTLERFTCEIMYFWNPNVTDIVFTCTRTQLEFIYRLVYNEDRKQFIIAAEKGNGGHHDSGLVKEFNDHFVGFEFIITDDKALLKEYNVNIVCVDEDFNKDVFKKATELLTSTVNNFTSNLKNIRYGNTFRNKKLGC